MMITVEHVDELRIMYDGEINNIELNILLVLL